MFYFLLVFFSLHSAGLNSANVEEVVKKYNIIVVDLDGTIVKRNVNIELFKKSMFHSPQDFFLSLWGLVKLCLGSRKEIYASNKKNIDLLDLDQEEFNVEVLKFLRELQGKITIILSTASDEHITNRVANYLKEKFKITFDMLLSSDEEYFNSGAKKLEKIRGSLPPGSTFLYIGDSISKDSKVWIDSNASIAIVGTEDDLTEARRLANKEEGILFSNAFITGDSVLKQIMI